MPWRGRSVTSGSGTTGWPGTSRNRKRCASVRDHDRRFEQRESLADAAPRTIAKRKISACRQPIREPFEPALRDETCPDRRNSADRDASPTAK